MDVQAGPAFRIDVEHRSDLYVIRVEGELDLAACPDLDRALSEATQTDALRIILDLEGLTFIDSCGLQTLVKATRRTASRGKRLRLMGGSGHPVEVFDLTALDKALQFADTSSPPVPLGTAPSAWTTRNSADDDANRPRTGEQFLGSVARTPG